MVIILCIGHVASLLSLRRISVEFLWLRVVIRLEFASRALINHPIILTFSEMSFEFGIKCVPSSFCSVA